MRNRRCLLVPGGRHEVQSDRVVVDTEHDVTGTKTCRYCAETVLTAAIKCKHCGSDISDLIQPMPRARWLTATAGLVLLLGSLGGLRFGWFLGTASGVNYPFEGYPVESWGSSIARGNSTAVMLAVGALGVIFAAAALRGLKIARWSILLVVPALFPVFSLTQGSGPWFVSVCVAGLIGLPTAYLASRLAVLERPSGHIWTATLIVVSGLSVGFLSLMHYAIHEGDRIADEMFENFRSSTSDAVEKIPTDPVRRVERTSKVLPRLRPLANGWNEYVSNSIGVRVEVPPGIEALSEFPIDGGAFITSADGAVVMTLSKLDQDASLEDAFIEAKRSPRQLNRRVTYEVQRVDWYVVSGVEGNDDERIFYEKGLSTPQGIISASLSFPATSRAAFDPHLKRFAESLDVARRE